MFKRKPRIGKPVVLFFFGQSNTAGRALMEELPETYRGLQDSPYNVRVWTPTGWQNHYPGVNTGDEAGKWGYVSICPYDLSRELGQDVYVVELSEGGTRLFDYWSPGNTGYIGIRDKAQAAIAALGGIANISPIAIFGQGEADATSATYSSVYQSNLETLIDTWRTDTGVQKWVNVGLHYSLPSGSYPQADVVRAAQVLVCGPSGTKSNTWLIDTIKPELSADNIHYSGAGYIELAGYIKDAIHGYL